MNSLTFRSRRNPSGLPQQDAVAHFVLFFGSKKIGCDSATLTTAPPLYVKSPGNRRKSLSVGVAAPVAVAAPEWAADDDEASPLASSFCFSPAPAAVFAGLAGR